MCGATAPPTWMCRSVSSVVGSRCSDGGTRAPSALRLERRAVEEGLELLTGRERHRRRRRDADGRARLRVAPGAAALALLGERAEPGIGEARRLAARHLGLDEVVAELGEHRVD